jgi:thiamine biosynthesis lipoprotein
MGTLWQITVDGDEVSQNLEQEIYTKTDTFDQQFSRFIESSQANAFRNSSPGSYAISPVFAELLQFAQQLKHETNGLFDPAIGSLLEAAGYDSEYCFRPNKEKVEQWHAPHWQVTGNQLSLSEPIVFDIGGYGKGYWVDQVAQLLTKAGHAHFLVDGGGDMFGTTKQQNQPWKIAIEKPGDPKKATATVELRNQGLAISDIFRRQWSDGNWNHTIDPKRKKPSTEIVGCAVLADCAIVADALTTCLTLVDEQKQAILLKKYKAEFMAVTKNQTLLSSQNWSGKLL